MPDESIPESGNISYRNFGTPVLERLCHACEGGGCESCLDEGYYLECRFCGEEMYYVEQCVECEERLLRVLVFR